MVVAAALVAAAQAQEADMAVATVADTAAAGGRVAVVAGATGLVGQEVLAVLLADKAYRAIHTLGRRATSHSHPKLTQHVVDFAKLDGLPQADEVYIALGTTIKVAGSKEAFRAVDLKAVEALALGMRAQGATKIGVVSAMGADTQSSVFYNRVKGEMEVSVARMGYPSTVIARPSLLDGAREVLGQPQRLGERVGLHVMRGLKGLIPANYQAIAARDVAFALVRAVQQGTPGVVTLLSGEMQGSASR